MQAANTETVLASAASAAVKKTTKKTGTTAKKKTTAKKTTKTTPAKKSATAKKGSSKRKITGKRVVAKKTAKKKTVSQRWTNPTTQAVEQPSNDSLTLLVNSRLLALIPDDQNPGGLRVNKVTPDHTSKIAKISLNDNFTYLPVTSELISSLQKEVTQALPDSLSHYKVSLNVGKHPLSYYISRIDPLPANRRQNPAFVLKADPWVKAKKGLEGDILAIWHSHGRYYKPSGEAWMWQRPFLFQSVEDTYTMGYVLPYLVPMLENAGAYVLLPRERDTNRNEVIVDNDTNPGGQIYSQPYYKEVNASKSWSTGEEEGFIYDLPDFRDTENPFENGTYRQVSSVTSGAPSVAAWYADIPEDGEYAVYVSYKTLPNSVSDARYTVNYSGGSQEFVVNQRMGGSTWVYLGTFPLEKGYSDTEPVVTLSNLSSSAGRIVTADAVKIGGGMGNISRSPRRSDVAFDPSTPEEEAEIEDNLEDSEMDSVDNVPDFAPQFRTSGLPRYLEGSRYWLHWAGFPEDVYSPYHGTDDYKDDYTSRGLWVNYLAGGSQVLPNDDGLGIPVDMVMALHSDAGKRADDSVVGTLGIYYTNGGDSYTDGTPRINSRMLTDLIMRQIVSDVRRTWEPSWTRRSMWDKSYVEARIPEVPTTLIELLSHQNFGDMQYGLDPNFKFTVARAIYKAIGKFMSERKQRDFIAQPLPISDFSIQRTKPSHYQLRWDATHDPLEPSAKPTRYIILERSGDELGFHKIGETRNTHFDVKTEDTELHSFQILAVNDGGLAFPSETLAFREGTDGKSPVLIVNGFTRLSGPQMINEGDIAGFDAAADFGVPYIKDISFTGYQTEFHRSAGESFGRSSSNEVSSIIAGNTFDFPAIHGQAISESGRGFVSCSLGAVEKGEVKLSDYNVVDLILGRQKATVVGNGKDGAKYHTFSEELRNRLTKYLERGGRLLVTGEYLASDPSGAMGDAKSAAWLRDVLGVLPDSNGETRSGSIISSFESAGQGFTYRPYQYSNTLNDSQYIVQHPDGLTPAFGFSSVPLMQFEDSRANAGLLLSKGKGRQVVMSVPFESLTDASGRATLMKEILEWLDK